MLKVGVVGVGSMGRHHLRIYSELADVELIGISDTDSELAKNYAKKFKTSYFKSTNNLLDKVQAVSICVPTTLHKELAIRAINKGIHILVEKPLAESSKSAEEIVNLAKNNDVKLMVGHVERFNPVVQYLKNLMNKEKPLLITITRVGPFPPRIKDVGIITDLGIHDIDIARYITSSEPVKIRSLINSSFSKYEDTAIISFELENGTLVQITTNWLTPFKVRQIEVATSDNFYRGDLISQRLQQFSKYKESGSYITKENPVKYQEPLKKELESFVSSIINNKEPEISGEDGLENIRITEKCVKLGSN